MSAVTLGAGAPGERPLHLSAAVGADTRTGVAARPSLRGMALAPPACGKRFVLADGRQAQVRPVRPSDASAERTFVETLSTDSRRRRFHGALAQLPMSLALAMTRIDFHRQVALVAEAPASDGAMRLVADARYVREEVARDEGGASAEFAIAVADDWQGQGLGRWLLGELAWHARLAGLTTLVGSVLLDNGPMLSLLERAGARFEHDREDARLVRAIVRL